MKKCLNPIKKMSIFVAMTLLVLGYADGAHAFWLNYHDNITKDALSQELSPLTLYWVGKYDRNVDLLEADLHEAHFDSESFTDGVARMQTLLQETAAATGGLNKHPAMQSFGRALHTLQDLYAHSSWVDIQCANSLSFAVYPELYELTDPPSDLVCNMNFADVADPLAITTGYFPDNTAPQNKCSHKQLNKDAEYANVPKYGSPNGQQRCNGGDSLHVIARTLATEHTDLFYQDLLAIMEGQFARQAESFIRFFAEDHLPVTFLTEETTTFHLISGWQEEDGNFVTTRDEQIDKMKPSMPFGRMSKSRDGVDPNFENLLTDMLLDLAQEKGRIVLILDELPPMRSAMRDTWLKTGVGLDLVIKNAEAATSDSILSRIARETGGLEWNVSSGDVSEALLALQGWVHPHRATLFRATHLSRLGQDFWVDSTLDRLNVAASGHHSLRLIQPDGQIWELPEQFAFFQIDQPISGAWRVEIEGGDLYIFGQSSLLAVDLYTASYKNRRDHLALVPVPDSEGNLSVVELTEPVQKLSLNRITSDGRIVPKTHLMEEIADMSTYVTSKRLSLKNQHEMLLTGVNAEGETFQRMFSGTLIQP